MKRCDLLVDVGRRRFLSGAGVVAAGAAASAVLPTAEAKAAVPTARVTYPSNGSPTSRTSSPTSRWTSPIRTRMRPASCSSSASACRAAPVPTATSSASRRSARTRAIRSPTTPTDRTLNCSGPLLGLRLRGRRPGDLGPRHPEPAAIRAAGRREGRHLRRGRGRAALRPPVQRALREDRAWPTSVRSTACRSSRRTPRNTTSCATTASSDAATRPTPGTSTSRARPTRPATSSASTSPKQQGAETEAWYAPVDVQHRQAGREGRPHRHQAGQELRRELRPRLDPRRPHGRDDLLARAQHRAAAPHRPDGLALRPDAADELGGRARPRRARHGRGDQRAGRGRALRLRLRPWRRRRRLREHLGHRQALLRRHEGEEHPHPQPPGLQLRGPRHPRHGRRRAQQLLRGRRARRHHRCGRRELARDADQLLPEPLGPEPARDLDGQEEGASCRTSRTSPRASSSSTRGGR